MPLLRKKPFQRLHVSSDFKDDDEVFLCAVTNEIFKDYNEFCERIILCNSMVWSCSITGKSGMTYEESLQCEEAAKESLKEFPMELRIPILYIANKTSRTCFSEMIEDVYQFAKERYFIGEMVEASFTEDCWSECHILQVIPPTEEQVKQCKLDTKNFQERFSYPPAKLFCYEVEQLDSGDADVSQLMIVQASQIRRKKHQYSRERNKIFLRMLCEQSDNGFWSVKESILQKYGINKVRFDSIFAGPFPVFSIKPKKNVVQKQEFLDKFVVIESSKSNNGSMQEALKTSDCGMVVKTYKKSRVNGKLLQKIKAKSLEEKQKLEEQKREKMLEKKERRKEEKLKKAALIAYIRNWYKPREDLECEDHRQIPDPIPLQLSVPDIKFGDLVLILEFLRFFSDELEVKTWFPNGLNLELLEKAIIVKEICGPFSDLVHLLLANIFKYQEEEDDDIDDNVGEFINHSIDQSSSMTEGDGLVTQSSCWSQMYQACPLWHLTINSFTISEILRQHLLSLGCRITDATTKWRYSQKGGFTNQDDTALLSSINNSKFLKSLRYRNMCELDVDDKLTLVLSLIDQLLAFSSIRDCIDEKYEKVQQAKKELKNLLLAEQKKEKEEKEKLKEREREGKMEYVDGFKPKIITRSNCEDERRKEEYENKVKKLQMACRNDQMMIFLGWDRAYRKYWRLLSVPGFFVESSDSWSGQCLPHGTPVVIGLESKDATYCYIKTLFEHECHDKENNLTRTKKSPKKIAIFDTNTVRFPHEDPIQIAKIRKNLLACTADKECPVHVQRPNQRWGFYSDPEDIEKLINSLNERGFRELDLITNLRNEQESLKTAINECPSHKLNPKVPQKTEDAVSKNVSKKNKYENTSLNYPPDFPLNDILEFSLCDLIIDLEEKITTGCLGTLKGINRDKWINAINNRKSSKQCNKGGCSNDEIEIDITPDNRRDGTVANSECIAQRVPPDFPEMSGAVLNKTQQSEIKKMSYAILQIAEGVDVKYLQKPFTEIQHNWKQSLMASTSWSQLFVHLNTLENNIMWSKSVLNAQCCICRKRKDGENMLLCDGCNKGHHLYCLKPKLQAVPAGDWFCQMCSRVRESRNSGSRRKKRKHIDDESEEDIVIGRETRNSRSKKLHLDEEDNNILKQKKAEKDSVSQSPCETSVCSVCKDKGNLLACDLCSKNFHVDCLNPPLPRLPRGRWSCGKCKDDKRQSDKETAILEDLDQPRQTRRKLKQAIKMQKLSNDESSIENCKTLLSELLNDIARHRDSWPFMMPVTVEEVPDYFEYISVPMDFGTINKKFSSSNYQSLSEFFSDCLLIFDNCRIYNSEHSSVYRAGARLLKFFEKRCKDLGFNYSEDQIRNPQFKPDDSEYNSNNECN